MIDFEKMREFIVDIEIPEGKSLPGLIPYDASGDTSKGRVKIYAISYEDAKKRLEEYLKQ